MKSSLFAFSCALLIYFCAAQQGSDILVTSNFSDYVNAHQLTAVMFYAPWCKHSQSFLPVWDEIASRLAGGDIGVGKVNCLDEKDLYWQNGIEGFPTLKVFHGKGRKVDPLQYNGEREIESVVKYINRMSESSLLNSELRLVDYAGFREAHLSSLQSLLLYFAPPNVEMKSGSLDYFEYVCKKTDNLACAASHDAELFSSLGGADEISGEALFIVRQFEEEESIKSAPWKALSSSKAMLKWAQDHSYPLLVEFSPVNEAVMFTSSRPGYNIHVVSVLDSKTGDFEEVKTMLRSVATGFSGKYVFVYIDVSNPSEYVDNILEDIRLTRNSAPTGMIIQSMKTKVQFFKWPVGTDINEESVRHWVSEFGLNNLPPTRTVDLSAGGEL